MSQTPIRHTLLSGTTRYGKSKACVALNAPQFLKPYHPSYWIFDQPGTMADEFTAHAVFAGKHLAEPTKLIVDHIAETSAVPGYPFIVPSTNPDPEQREAENRETISEAIAMIVREEGKLDAGLNPMIRQGLEDALKLFIYQRQPVPFYWLAKCFDADSPEYAYLLANCTDADTVRRFLRYGRLRGKDWEFNCGPADRRLKALCGCVQLRKRCRPTFDVVSFINRGGIWIGNGASRGNLSRQDVGRIFGMVLLMLIRLARSGMLKRRVVLIIDEGVATGLIDGNIIRAMMEAAKWNIEIQVICQNVLTLPRDISDNLIQLCDRQFHFRQVSPAAAKFVADLIGTPNYNPLKVKFREYFKRMVDDGYDVIPTESFTNAPNGTISSHYGSTFRPRKREEEEERVTHYRPDELLKLGEKDIRSADPGWCLFMDGNTVSEKPVYVPMLPMPWSVRGEPMIVNRLTREPLWRRKLSHAMQMLKTQPEYQTSEEITLCPEKKKRTTAME